MPCLPTDAVPAAEFIVRRMYRAVELAEGIRFSAVSETEKPVGGDDWFWTDDNAKVLEFLSRPEVWARYPQQTGKILEFVRAMCRPPFIFRRLSTPRLDATESCSGPIGGFRHSLMNIRYDLQRGMVVAGMRFHDERNFDNVLFSSNLVQFTYRGRRYQLPVEPAIDDVAVSQNGDIVSLRYAAELRFTPKRHSLRIGNVGYRYSIDARSMLIEVEASLDIEPGMDLSDVTLSIGHDQLSQWHYSTVDAATRQASVPLFSAGQPGRTRVNVAGSSYYVIRQGHFSGEALALHAVPREPGRLSEIELTAEVPGRLQRATTFYHFPGDHRGATLAAAEHKLLTGGGFYERIADYSEFMRSAAMRRSAQQAAYDFSTSYDYGVVINAFAKCYVSCAVLPDRSESNKLRAELRPLIDVYLKHYLDHAIEGHWAGRNTIFSRELAFVVLAVVTMYRATGAPEYRNSLAQLCDVLLDLERRFTDAGNEPASGFVMRIDAPMIAHVDCHSAALLALAQAAGVISDSRFVAAIDRGLAAYCLETVAIDLGRPHRVDCVGVLLIDASGNRRIHDSYWNFTAGLSLRLFAVLRNAVEPALREVAERHRERIDLFETILRRQIEQAIGKHDDAIEIRCSALSAETNSETQPWVMLGLLGHPAD